MRKIPTATLKPHRIEPQPINRNNNKLYVMRKWIVISNFICVMHWVVWIWGKMNSLIVDSWYWWCLMLLNNNQSKHYFDSNNSSQQHSIIFPREWNLWSFKRPSRPNDDFHETISFYCNPSTNFFIIFIISCEEEKHDLSFEK